LFIFLTDILLLSTFKLIKRSLLLRDQRLTVVVL